MYKVLIVDDEYYIRQRLRTCIEWEREGFEVGGLAQNAQEAFEMLSGGGFDLAVVDISMPQKDGLTLIKELREEKNPVKVIILSGFGTFEYAQKAIKYGVTEYLLKPIDEEELIKSLGKIRSWLDEENDRNKINQERYHASYLLSTIQKENYFKKIFTDHPLLISDVETLETQLKNYGLKVGGIYRVLVFDLQSTYFQDLSLADIQLYQYAVENVIAELTGQCFEAANSTDVFSHGVVVCEQKEENPAAFFSVVNEFVRKVKETLNLDICFGCSQSFELSLKNLNGEYYHALLAYVLSNLHGRPYEVFEASAGTVPIPFSVNHTLEKIEAFFSSGDEAGVRSSIDELFRLLGKEPYSFFSLDQTLFRLITVCSTRAAEGPASLSDDLSFLLGYKELLYAGYSLEYIKRKILQFFLSMLTKQSAGAGNTKELLMEEAMNFINAHYSRCDINLTLISKNLLISPSYLSTVFKKSAGISVNQYITKLRMEKSKEFLKNDQLTLTEIAERIGYQDAFYFSRVFKRYFGVSPSAYRN